MDYTTTLQLLKAVVGGRNGDFIVATKEKEEDSWNVLNLRDDKSHVEIVQAIESAIGSLASPESAAEQKARDAELEEDDIEVVEELDEDELAAIEQEGKDQPELDADNDIKDAIALFGDCAPSASQPALQEVACDNIDLTMPPVVQDRYVKSLRDLPIGKLFNLLPCSENGGDVGDEHLWEPAPTGDDDFDGSDTDDFDKSKYFTPHKAGRNLIRSTRKAPAVNFTPANDADLRAVSPESSEDSDGEDLDPTQSLFTPASMTGQFNSDGTPISTGRPVKKLRFTSGEGDDDNDMGVDDLVGTEDVDMEVDVSGVEDGPVSSMAASLLTTPKRTLRGPGSGDDQMATVGEGDDDAVSDTPQIGKKRTRGEETVQEPPRRSLRQPNKAAAVKGKMSKEVTADQNWPKEQIVYDVPPDSAQPRVFRESPTSPPSTLLSTQYLSLYRLRYNTFGFIVCLECSSGVALDQLHYHLTGHGHKVPSKAKLTDRVLQGLGAILNEPPHLRCTVHTFIRDNKEEYASVEDAMEPWRATVRPLGGSREPLQGLKIHKPGYCCNVPPCSNSPFPYCSPKYATLKHHWSQHDVHTVKPTSIPVKKRYMMAQGVQTIFSTKGNILYFPVNLAESPAPAAPLNETITNDDITNALRLEANSVLGDLGTLAGHSVLINPVFKDMQMTFLWDELDMADVRSILAIRPVVRKNASKKTQNLLNAVIISFMALAESARRAHDGILRLITAGALNAVLASRPFYVPQQNKTLSRYLLFEVQFLRHMLYVFNHPIKKKSGPEAGTAVFKFDADQVRTLRKLTEELNEGMTTLSALADTVIETLNSLYFPHAPENAAFDRFSQPLITYITVMCLTPEGSPIPLPHIPVYLSKVQFSMRLRAYHRIYTRYSLSHATPTPPTRDPSEPASEGPAPSSESAVKEPQRRSSRLGGKPGLDSSTSHLSSEVIDSERQAEKSGRKVGSGDSDYAADSDHSDDSDDSEDSEDSNDSLGAKRLAAGTSYSIDAPARKYAERGVSMGQPQQTTWYHEALAWIDIYLNESNVSPYASVRMLMHLSSCAQRNAKKLPFIQWNGEKTMVFNQERFQLDEFTRWIRYHLSEVEKLFLEILYGRSLEDLGINCDFTKVVDSGDVTTVGYGPLLSDQRPLNPDAEKLLVDLVKKKQLVSMVSDGVAWNTKEAHVWSSKISVAVERLAVICHILQGSPGRGSEELVMQSSNTTSGRRHLFIDNEEGLMLLFSNYWKGAHIAGRFHEVVRVLPHRAARLLFTLVRVVRPVELLFLAKSMNSTERGVASDAYFSALWASRGAFPHSEFILDATHAFFQLPAEDGTYPFRWITGVRMWRHLVVSIQRRHFPDSRYTKEVASRGTTIADSQAGRAGTTSTQYYAVLKSSVPADAGLLAHYILFSKSWHTFFEESTTFEPERTYIV